MITTTKGKLLSFSSNPKRIKKIAVNILSALQDNPKGDIVVALSVLWLMLCDRFSVSPSDVLTVAENLKNRTINKAGEPEFKAIKEYLEDEF